MDPGADEQPDRAELASRVDQLEQTVSKMLPDRRGVIKGLGAAAIGGAAVGASSGGASGQSAAGQVGTESSPEDVFAFDLDVQGALQRDLDAGGQAIENAGSVNAGAAVINGGQPQGFQDGRIVIQTPGSGLNNSINPDDFTNPINEAINQAAFYSVIYLPPDGVSQPDDIILDKTVALRGPGNTSADNTSLNCIVEITNPTTAGILIQNQISRMEWGGFRLHGPGDGSATPPAIKIDGANGGQINGCEIHPLIFRDWGGAVIEAPGSADKEFANVWHSIYAFNVDAGNESAMIQLGQAPPSVWGTVQLYPSATHSGSNSTALRMPSGEGVFEYIGVGNAIGQIASVDGSQSNFQVETIRYEATNQQSEPFSLFTLQDDGVANIGSVLFSGSGSTQEVVFITGTTPANKYIGDLHDRTGNFTVNGDYIRVNADTKDVAGAGDAPIRTALTSGQVNNSTGGTLTQPIACLGDLSTVS